MTQMVKCLSAVWKTRVRSLGWEDPLEKMMATHSSVLTWKISWTARSGRLQSMGSQSRTWLSDFTFPEIKDLASLPFPGAHASSHVKSLFQPDFSFLSLPSWCWPHPWCSTFIQLSLDVFYVPGLLEAACAGVIVSTDSASQELTALYLGSQVSRHVSKVGMAFMVSKGPQKLRKKVDKSPSRS